MEEKKILKELLYELAETERDLRISLKTIIRTVPNESKIDIVKNLNQVENAYYRNLDEIKQLDYKYIKKDLKKLEKVLNKINIMKTKIETSISKEVI